MRCCIILLLLLLVLRTTIATVWYNDCSRRVSSPIYARKALSFFHALTACMMVGPGLHMLLSLCHCW